jgi:hypothetical protein
LSKEPTKELSQTQRDQLKPFAEKWVKCLMIADPEIEKEDVEIDIRRTYAAAKLSDPSIYIVDSPAELEKLQEKFDKKTKGIKADLMNPLRELQKPENLVVGAAGQEIKTHIVDEISQFSNPIRQSRLWQLDRMHRIDCFNMTFWFAMQDFLIEAMGFEHFKAVTPFLQTARYAHGVAPYDGACVVCKKPISASFDDRQRFHNEEAMAVQFPDGAGEYVWHGIKLEPWIIENPERICAKNIEAETNIEIRRIMIEKIGIETYFEDAQFKHIHTDGFGELYERSLGRWDTLKIVKVVNSTPEPDGSFKNYFLVVHPNCTTAHEAVARSFGLEPSEYDPPQQT